MGKLIDTNIIIRYLIEANSLKVLILDSVISEVVFVLNKFYKIPKDLISQKLKKILSLKGVVNSDKVVLIEALTIFENKNLDFVDALICAKSKIEGYEYITFDKEMEKKC